MNDQPLNQYRVVLYYDLTPQREYQRYSIEIGAEAVDASHAVAQAVEVGRAAVKRPTFNWCVQVIEWLQYAESETT
jgi:hypothetical protein